MRGGALPGAGRSGDRGSTCDRGSENKRLALLNHLHQLTVCIFFTDLSLLGYLVRWAGRPKRPCLPFPVPRAVWLRHGRPPIGRLHSVGFPGQGGTGTGRGGRAGRPDPSMYPSVNFCRPLGEKGHRSPQPQDCDLPVSTLCLPSLRQAGSP